MKLLHVLAQLPTRTGSGVYFTNLIEGLAEYGYEQRAVFATQDGYQWDGSGADVQYPVTFKTPSLPFPIAGMSEVISCKRCKWNTTHFLWQTNRLRHKRAALSA